MLCSSLGSGSKHSVALHCLLSALHTHQLLLESGVMVQVEFQEAHKRETFAGPWKMMWWLESVCYEEWWCV